MITNLTARSAKKILMIDYSFLIRVALRFEVEILFLRFFFSKKDWNGKPDPPAGG
jgi:hypothetical protein